MARTHLLDTSVASEPLKHRPLDSVTTRWRALGDEQLCLSAIGHIELLQGLLWKNSERLWRAYRSVIKNKFPILPVDAGVAETYARLSARFRTEGRPKPVFDLLIASTALHHGLIVATCNMRDFSGIEGLVAEDWRASL